MTVEFLLEILFDSAVPVLTEFLLNRVTSRDNQYDVGVVIGREQGEVCTVGEFTVTVDDRDSEVDTRM